MNNYDIQYKKVIESIIKNGVETEDRTGVGTIKTFFKTIEIDLSEGFPLLTSRFISFKISFYETMMFLNGATDSKKWLEDNGINIWSGNTSREFLDSRGLNHLEVGDIGKSYGYQWRNFNSNGIDQLKDVFNMLKTNPNDRRMIVTSWNPNEINEMALPPCLHTYQFYVENNKLSVALIMRSCDTYNGVNYNISMYGLIVNLFAKALKMEVGNIGLLMVDAHLYLNSITNAVELLTKDIHPLPKLIIKKELNTLEDICSLKFEDVEIVDYVNSGRMKKVPMAV